MSTLPSGESSGKTLVTDEELAGILDPVLAEHRLHGVHDGPAQSHAEIAHVVGALRVPQPAIDDAVTANERDTAIQHYELAMIAVIEHADVA